MSRCSTCRHWGSGDGNQICGTGYEVIHPVGDRASRDGWKPCGFVPHSGDEDDGQALVMVQDGSGYAGGLYTHPDFGCIHWQEKS